MRRTWLSALAPILASLVALTQNAPSAEAAWPTNPATNLLVGSSVVSNQPSGMVSDGAGGAFIVIMQGPNGSEDIYVQHVAATGAIAPGWPVGGALVCNAAGKQQRASIMLDGAGGVFVAWDDERAGVANADIFVQRVTAAGTISAGWPANGRNVSIFNEAKYEYAPQLASDGAGGCFIAWTLTYTSGTDDDIYAARVDGSGAVVWSSPIDQSGDVQHGPSMCSDNAGGVWLAYDSHNNVNGFDIPVLRVNSSGFPTYLSASAANNDQLFPRIAPDGAGGCFVVWQDGRLGSDDIYVNRLTTANATAPGYPPDGLPVCIDGASSQQMPVVAADGGGGIFVAWTDSRYDSGDIFGTHLTSGGSAFPGWPFGGLAISTVFGSQFRPSIISDGAGGALVTWEDERSGIANLDDVYAIRMTSSGLVAPGWPIGGAAVSIATYQQAYPLIVTDGANGAICTWIDYRNWPPNVGTYAQRIDRFGQLGDASPTLVSVRDVTSDQGGHVRITWNPSYLDVDPTDGISNYWVWRQAPIASALAAVRNGARWLDDALASDPRADVSKAISADEERALTARGLYLRSADAAAQYAWEFIASQPASQLSQYSYVASTTSDSTLGHNPYTPFIVQARATGSSAFWSSAPDSGYSVDNIPPAAPAPFTGNYATGSTKLHWGANHEADFASYRLYRGSSPGFTPGPDNFVTQKPDTGYVDVVGSPYFYKLAAVDIHGNVSPYAFLQPTGTVSVDDALPAELMLAPAFPNPAHASTTLRFELPRAGHVKLALYDASGRRVRALINATLPAGDHSALWDGRDDSGAMAASGLYFVALTCEGRSLRGRLAIVR